MNYQAIKKLQDISKIWLTFALICINPPRTRRTFTHILMAGGYFPCTVIPSDDTSPPKAENKRYSEQDFKKIDNPYKREKFSPRNIRFVPGLI